MKAILRPEGLVGPDPLILERETQATTLPVSISPDSGLGKAASLPAQGLAKKVSAYLELTKPRINSLILLVAAAGYWIGAGGAPDRVRMLITLVGIALLGGGIFALNQFLERDLDAVMHRTESRPLPTGRLRPSEALWFGLSLSMMAVICLTVWVNPLSGALAIITFGSYLFVYTPLKTRTPYCTPIGAIPGAMPPLLGWVAARGELGLEALVLFAILFFWQFPHFHSIAWLYREDYSRAGIRMLPVIEPDGRMTGQQIIGGAVLLLVASLLPTVLGISGEVYFGGALMLGILFVYLGVSMALERSKWQARRLLLASVLYLPLLFGLMVFNSGGT